MLHKALILTLTLGTTAPFTNLESTEPSAYRWPIATNSTLAQTHFRQGMLLFYGFNADEATRSFDKAIQEDPQCALCYWGKVMAADFFGNVALAQADFTQAQLLSKQHLGTKPTPDPTARFEAELVDTAAPLFDATLKSQHSRREAYAEALGELRQRWPDHPEAATLHGAALLLSASSLCHGNGARTEAQTNAILEALERALELSPDHPGAHHLYIHAAETTDTPERARNSAQRLPSLAPGIAHFAHMPSHLFLRMGDYHDAVLANDEAIAIDEAYLLQSPIQGTYYEGFYLHNYHFLWAAALQGGEIRVARQAAQAMMSHLRAAPSPNMLTLVGTYQSLPILTEVRMARWDAILTMSEPANPQPFVRAVYAWSRAMAHWQRGDDGAAQREFARFEAYRNILPALRDDAALGAMQHTFEAYTAVRQGQWAAAETQFAAALAYENTQAFAELPLSAVGVREFWAAVWFTHDAPRAIALLRDNLQHYPRHGFTLLALYQAYRAIGDADAAAQTLLQLEDAWQFADDALLP